MARKFWLALDGEQLLNIIHDLQNHDSLVYWLEYKNDDEFINSFGSIAGGSALKFGIFKRKETGIWITGSPQNQKEITIAEAIEISRQHRNEFIAGCKILNALPENADNKEYEALQKTLERVSPTINNTAWGHKYFHLNNPTKLDDYHNPDFQKFHLIKALITPPEGNGRYLAAGLFVGLAHELDIPINNLTNIMNIINGRPHRYWRIGTKDGASKKS